MDIITKKTDFSKSFYLHFYINGTGTEFLDYDLPFPTYQKHANKGYYIAWAINGYFGTKQGAEYLRDIKLRFVDTFKAEICPFRPNVKNDKAKVFLRAYELKEFSTRLNSIKNISNFNLNMNSYKDEVFWKIKIYAELRIKENGIVAYEDLLSFADANCKDEVKDYSTLKAKCRSIWHWYNQRDYEYGTHRKKLKDRVSEEEYKQILEKNKMTRQEIAKQNTKKLIDNSINKITVAVNALREQNKLFKPNGKPNISQVAKISQVSRNTVMKYIQNII